MRCVTVLNVSVSVCGGLLLCVVCAGVKLFITPLDIGRGVAYGIVRAVGAAYRRVLTT